MCWSVRTADASISLCGIVNTLGSILAFRAPNLISIVRRLDFLIHSLDLSWKGHLSFQL